jgi:hypothetical protein
MAIVRLHQKTRDNQLVVVARPFPDDVSALAA